MTTTTTGQASATPAKPVQKFSPETRRAACALFMTCAETERTAISLGITPGLLVKAYHIARLLGIRLEDAAGMTLENRMIILAKIKAALEVSRNRGRTGNTFPGYDINRHHNLADALLNEMANVSVLQDMKIAELSRELELLRRAA